MAVVDVVEFVGCKEVEFETKVEFEILVEFETEPNEAPSENVDAPTAGSVAMIAFFPGMMSIPKG